MAAITMTDNNSAKVGTTGDENTQVGFDLPVEFDVSNNCERVCGCCMTKILRLEDDEAVLTTKNLCSESKQRRPYAQLGSVDIASACGCCFSFSSDLSPGVGDNPGKWGLFLHAAKWAARTCNFACTYNHACFASDNVSP